MHKCNQNCRKLSPLKATGLLCDFTGNTNIPVINNPAPVFSWKVDGSGKNAFQTACRIIVASKPDDNSVAWDSEKVSCNNNFFKYSGNALKAETTYFWKLQLWDTDGGRGNFTSWRMFRTGSLNSADNLTVSQSMVLQNRVHPEILRKRSRDSYFIDFGKDAFAGLELYLHTGKEQVIELRLGEEISSDGTIHKPEPFSHECSRRFRKISLRIFPKNKIYRVEIPKPFMGDGYQTKNYNNRDRYSILCPKHTGELMPFRYLEIRGYEHELKLTDIVQLPANFPFDDEASHFRCSDQNLNSVWDFCKYTVKATTPFAIYIDGDRERLPYAGDTYINQLSHYCCDREYSIARNTLDYFFATGADWPFEAVLSIILIAHSDYFYTGDISVCAKYYDKLKAMLFNELVRDDGLLVTGEISGEHILFDKIKTRLKLFRDLIDWPKIFRGNYEIGEVNTVTNCFLYRALIAFCDIASGLERKNDYKNLKAKAEKLKIAVRAKLFNSETGLFLDSEGSSHSSPHANFHAAAAGLVSRFEQKNIVNLLKNSGMPCGLWGAQFLLEGLFQADAENLAIKLMSSDGPRSWLNMLKQGATMTMECWSNELQSGQDWNHPWATAPLNVIPRFLMGIKPLEPGFRKILIQPRPGHLKHASLVMPTINGAVSASFKKEEDYFNLKITIPGNCQATVVLSNKLLNKKAVKLLINSRQNTFVEDKVSGCIIVPDLPPGKHNLALQTESGNVKILEYV